MSTHDDFRPEAAKAKNDFDARAKALELARQFHGPGIPIKSVLVTAAQIETYLQTGKAN